VLQANKQTGRQWELTRDGLVWLDSTEKSTCPWSTTLLSGSIRPTHQATSISRLLRRQSTSLLVPSCVRCTHAHSLTLARISVSDNEHLSTTSTAVLSEYPLADEHHRVISNWLLSVLVPRIYHSWFELYCTTANVRAIQQRGHLMSGVGMLTHPRDVTIITVPTK